MAPIAQTDPNFAFRANPTPAAAPTFPPAPPVPPTPPNPPPSPLDQLVGTWRGTGFNTIWRPHFPSTPQDRFLELNLTAETVTFSPISGPIPNRGLLQEDIDMFGLTYLQQISDASDGGGLHIEPGIWVIVPATTAPAVPPTVVRMASIPHGTAIVAQGTAVIEPSTPNIPAINIIPFGIGSAPPPNSEFASEMATFSEMNLAVASQFRTDPLPPGITQAMVEDPNSVLRGALTGTVRTTTTLAVTSTSTPVPGGGTANTAFLQGDANQANQGGNANATSVTATFWIELVESPPGPDTLQLQYSQTVMLDFNGLRWPHVTVATLRKQ